MSNTTKQPRRADRKRLNKTETLTRKARRVEKYGGRS